MIVSITSIELKSPFKFFPLSLYAMRILKQLKHEQVVKYKSVGFWTMHYTMSSWENEADMMQFVKHDAHLAAMKRSKKIAKEIRLHSFDAEDLPDWKTAKGLLKEKGRVIKFK